MVNAGNLQQSVVHADCKSPQRIISGTILNAINNLSSTISSPSTEDVTVLCANHLSPAPSGCWKPGRGRGADLAPLAGKARLSPTQHGCYTRRRESRASPAALSLPRWQESSSSVYIVRQCLLREKPRRSCLHQPKLRPKKELHLARQLRVSSSEKNSSYGAKPTQSPRPR